jgi:carboxymethylenebutenolidase
MKTILASTLVLTLATAASAQDFVKERLDKSPRHHEWVKVKQGDRTVHSFVVYPETKGKATAVLVIHENKGLTDWVRGVADQLAEAGYNRHRPRSPLRHGAGRRQHRRHQERR